MSLLKLFRKKIPPRLHDLLWPQDLKERLFVWTCIGIIFVIAAFLISEQVALLLYNYSFCISPGTSFGKVTTLLAWLLCSYLIVSILVRRKWQPPRFRTLFISFLILVALLFLVNVLAFYAMFNKAGVNGLEVHGGERPVVVGFNPEATVNYSSSTLGHTHSLKPVLYWFFNHFIDADGMDYDVGAALYPLFPAPGLVCPIVIALLLAYFVMCMLILVRTANGEKKSYLAWFNCLVFSLASFTFFEATLDGGPFTTYVQVGIALLSLYLLMRYVSRKQGKGWALSLIFLPLLVLASLNLLFYNLGPRVISLHEHFLVSTLSIAAAGFYEFSRRGIRSILLVPILFLLAFNFSSVRPYPLILESREGDAIYMILTVDPSTTENEILERVARVPDLTTPEILARDARTVVVKADVGRTGVTSQDLAHLVAGRRMAPFASSIRFRFGDPSSRLFYSVYLPVDEVELRQVLPGRGPVQIDFITELSQDFVKVDYYAPEGLYASHYLMLALSQRGMHLTNYIYMRPSTERSAATQARDFLRMLLPMTRLQPIITIVFP